jgi:hypothetical protein
VRSSTAKRHGALRVSAKAVSDPPAAAAPAAVKRVYTFGNGTADGDASMKTLLGGRAEKLES